MITVSGTPALTTERLTLRMPASRDWEAYAEFLTSERAAMIGGPLSRDKAWRSFGHAVGHWVLRGYGMFFVTPRGSDTAIGMTGPWFPEGWPEPELGWSMFGGEHEGKGLAFEAAEVARRYAFQKLGWKTAVSYIDPANLRSIALAERLGALPDPAAPCPEGVSCLVYRHASVEVRP
ncbi:GNAT family N-acetyltransferase [Cereibacter changlensis]|uniref:GNAT family N-acetyltransferase n=1 Tax=Cereibacter changlensis TaxID=402884 RepID=UPI0040333B85